MNDPVAEISGVVTTLCTADFSSQQKAIEKYFMPNAQFIHPFCRTPNREARWHIKRIYQWYKILSPDIAVNVDSVAFDKASMILYLSIHQTFKIRFLPWYKAQPNLVTKLELTHGYGEAFDDDSYAAVTARDPKDAISRKFYIKSQEDFYQTDQFIKFLAPWLDLASRIINMLQIIATVLCVLGCFVVTLPATLPVWLWNPIKNTRNFIGSRETLLIDEDEKQTKA